MRSLEAEFQRALHGKGVALQVGNDFAMAPGAFDADIDKGHRAPDQVDVREGQLLVVGGPAEACTSAGMSLWLMLKSTVERSSGVHQCW